MQQQQPAQALAAYQHSMMLYPKRFNSLLGAARTARALGDEAASRGYYQELLQVAASATRSEVLAEARRYGSPVRGR